MAYRMTVLNPGSKGKKKMAKKKTPKRKPAKKRSTRKKTSSKKKATKKKTAKKRGKKKATKRKPAKKKAAKRKPAKKKAAKRKPAKKKAAKRKPAKKKAAKRKPAKKKAAKRKPAKKKATRKAPVRRKKAAKKAPVRAARKSKRWPKKVSSTTTAGKKKTTRVPKIRYTVPQGEDRLRDAAAYVGTSKFTGKRRRAKLPGLAGAAQRMQLKSQGYLALNPKTGNPMQPVPGFPRMFVRTPSKGAKSRKVTVALKVGSRDSTRAGRGSTKARAPSKAKQAEIDRIRKKYGIKKKK